MGNLEEGSFTGDFETWMRQTFFSTLAPTCGGGPSTGNLEN
jgi:hypothetical protein